jgi:hypothetical protein
MARCHDIRYVIRSRFRERSHFPDKWHHSHGEKEVGEEQENRNAKATPNQAWEQLVSHDLSIHMGYDKISGVDINKTSVQQINNISGAGTVV